MLVNLTIQVRHNLSTLNRTLRGLLPGNGVRVSTVGGAIVLSGSVQTAREAEDARRLARQFVSSDKKVINRLRISGPNQINLRVRIVEISRNVTRNIGINWDAAFSIGSNIVLGFATGGATTVGNVFPPNFPIQTRVNGVNNGFIAHRGQRHNVNALIDALQTQGMVKTLAEPNLTTVSGETASFLAGGEFPVPVPQDGGVITVTFKKFGVGLSFTPTLLSGGRISLKVQPEVSQLSNAGAIQIQGINVPSLTTRRASTTVELASGQAFAIAGLLQNNFTKDLSKVPGIGDIPVLGKLFTSENFRRDETELVIIVTPYVVRPFDPQKARRAAAARAANAARKKTLAGYSWVAAASPAARPALPRLVVRVSPVPSRRGPPEARRSAFAVPLALSSSRRSADMPTMQTLSGLRFSLVLGATAVLGGCVTGQSVAPEARMNSNHVRNVELTHDVVFAGSSTRITKAGRNDLAGFLRRTGVRYGDRVIVSAGAMPGKKPARLASARRERVGRYMRFRGVKVLYGSHRGTGIGAKIVRVSVRRSVVIAPNCPDWDTALAGSALDGKPNRFGCLNSAALAAMIADPNDLRRGRRLDAGDADYQTLWIRNYRAARPSRRNRRRPSKGNADAGNEGIGFLGAARGSGGDPSCDHGGGKCAVAGRCTGSAG